MKISLRMPVCLQGLTIKEKVLCVAEGCLVCVILGYFFYKSVIWTIAMLPIAIIVTRKKAIEIREIKKGNMLNQFRGMVDSINGSIQAGYSLENAFESAGKDMAVLYGRDSGIVKEVIIINKGIANGGSLTDLLDAFADRSGIDEIAGFAEIIAVGKMSGGNITAIMAAYVKMIDEKLEVKQEIETMISARKYEQKIMNVVPFIILAYMELTNPGIFSMLYHNLFGNIIMTICLILYITAINMAEKIMKIEV